ncbi:hypothetical protein HDU80_009242, partial [Chytriomyces hyalinus]
MALETTQPKKAGTPESSEQSTLPSSAQAVSQIHWNVFTFATVSWLNPLLRLGYQRPLTEEDLPDMQAKEQAAFSVNWLDAYMAQHVSGPLSVQKKPKLTLLNALLPHVLPLIGVDALCQLIGTGLTICMSLMIEQ